MQTPLRKPDMPLLGDYKKRLADIALEIGSLSREAKSIEAHIMARFEENVTELFKKKDEPFGAVSLDEEGVPFTVTIPKKIDWDQAALARTVAEISASGHDASEYVKITYDVPEAKYKAWPSAIKAQFEPARTVTPGKPKIAFKEGE